MTLFVYMQYKLKKYIKQALIMCENQRKFCLWFWRCLCQKERNLFTEVFKKKKEKATSKETQNVHQQILLMFHQNDRTFNSCQFLYAHWSFCSLLSVSSSVPAKRKSSFWSHEEKILQRINPGLQRCYLEVAFQARY